MTAWSVHDNGKQKITRADSYHGDVMQDLWRMHES